MVRKSRSDKKDTTCKRCGKVCVNPNKLREHLRRKNPCKPLTVNQEAIQEPIQPLIQTPIQISIQTPPIQESNQQPIQEAIQKPVQIPNKDTSFKNPDIEWNYQEVKSQLSTFENLQQETCCRPEDFDRKRFYLEMKKEGNKPYTGMITSKWSMFINSAFEFLQRAFDRKRGGYIDKKGIVAEIRKEIFSEKDSDTHVQVPIQTSEAIQIHKNEKNIQNRREEQALIPILGKDYITKEEAKRWVNPNARKPNEHFRKWGARLHKRWVHDLGLGDHRRPENLADCRTLCHDLEQYDEEAGRLPTKEEYEEYQTNNEEFRRLGGISEEQEKDLEFREQEELGMALRRRAIAVHHAKVPKSHPDNGSDIRKMLESQRKQFKEVLEKEFDKRGQFKFALCSLTKFLIDDKPGSEKQGKKNSRTDWLRNKQIIVYNRAEIEDYLSDAFEQILYQVEERGGKSNA